MARTDLQRQVLRYMRGAPIELEIETKVLTQTLDELVARGDLELWKVGHPGMSERFVEYRLTQQGRGPADGGYDARTSSGRQSGLAGRA